jgi:hypothetical protein
MATVLADLAMIHGVGTGITIGDNRPVWEQRFKANGRERTGNAVLVFMVRGLTGTNGAEVRLNNKVIGMIDPYPGADSRHWFMQMINITALPEILLDGDNELQVNAAPHTNPSPGDIYEDFTLKNFICIFQQST